VFSRRKGGRFNRGRIPLGSRPFTPARLSGLVAWWDPTLGVSLIGADVTDWADQAAGGTADDLAAEPTEEPTYVAADGGYPAIDFDRSGQHLEAADSADLSPTTAFSWVGWIKPANVAFGDRNIINQRGTERLIFRLTTTDVVQLLVHDGSGFSQATDTSTFTDGVWYHVAWVFDGSGATDADKCKLYIDKSLRTLSYEMDAWPSAITDNTAPLEIGAKNSDASSSYNGRLGYLTLYDRALTLAEITQLYDYQRRK